MAEQLAGFQFAKPFDVTNPVSTDKRYGKFNGSTTIPFANTAEAIDLIKPALRYQGLQCVIANGAGSINLYWWRDGVADNQLVLLQPDVDISGKADKTYVDNQLTAEAAVRESTDSNLAAALITGNNNTLSEAKAYTDSHTTQATELVNGTAKITISGVIKDENTVEDLTFVTPKKWWQGVERLLGLNNIFNGICTFANGFKIGNSSLFGSFSRSLTSNELVLTNKVYQSGSIGGALTFNGTNQRGTFGNLPAYTNLSISIWIKPANLNEYTLIKVGNAGLSAYGIGISVNGSVRISDAIGSQGVSGSNGIIAANKWSHIVAANNGSITKLYINGVLIGTKTGATPVSVAQNNTNALAANNNNGSFGTYYAGAFDQTIIYNREITQLEVSQLYNSGFGTASPPVSGMIARWEFDELNGSVVNDGSGNNLNLTLINNPNWSNLGKVPTGGSASEATVFKSIDGITNGERGQQTFGDNAGGNIQQGKAFRVLINGTFPVWIDNFGRTYIDPAFNGYVEGAGNVSTAYLQLGAGKSTAGNAAFKFSPGALLTTPENGAWEYDNSNIYFTIGSNRIKVNANLQTATDQGNATNNDIEITGTSKGLILKDIGDGTRQKITIVNGILSINPVV